MRLDFVSEVKLLEGLSDFEWWLFLALCGFALLFLILAIILIFSQRSGGKGRVVLLVFCITFFVLLIVASMAAMLEVLEKLKIDFFDKLSSAVNSREIHVPYLILLVDLLVCIGLLLFKKGKRPQQAVATENAFYPELFIDDEDDENDDAHLNDVFKELKSGGAEAYVDKVSQGLYSATKPNGGKSTVDELSKVFDEKNVDSKKSNKSKK